MGITHTEPEDPIWEVNLAHSTWSSRSISTSANFTKAPFALGTVRSEPWLETHLWAPHIVQFEVRFSRASMPPIDDLLALL